MKKIVGIIAAAALAASAFAEVNIGAGFNRFVFVPFAYDGDTVRTMEGVSWSGTNYGGAGGRVGLAFSASTENAGMVLDIHANPGDSGETIGLGDNGYIWVKPAEIFKVALGKFDNHWGRLDECFGDWDTWRMANVTVGEGIGGVDRTNGTGACFTLTPIEGLVIDYQACFGATDDNGVYDKDTYEYKADTGSVTHNKGDVKNTIGNVRSYHVFWEGASLMVGYKADFGFIRAIVNGQKAAANSSGDSTPWAKISVAADITAVENMTFKLGATIPTMLDSGYNPQDVLFAAGADFDFSPVKLHLVADMGLKGKVKDDDASKAELKDFTMKIGAGVDYDINDALTAVAAVRFANDKVVKDGAFGVFAGLTQKLSNASINYGVELGKNVGPSAKADDFTFAVPLTITASF